MKIGPKYKIARSLGAPVFDKTQTQKFDQALQRKGTRPTRRRRAPSEYSMQLKEKQKARYVYLISERQFSRYVKESSKTENPSNSLYQKLEMRLDNVAYKMGLAPTKTAARQLTSHGHLTVNGKRMTVPSHIVKVGDVITVREGSKNTKLFDDLNDRLQNYTAPTWLVFNEKSLSGEIKSKPSLNDADLLFDIQAILEFYSR